MTHDNEQGLRLHTVQGNFKTSRLHVLHSSQGHSQEPREDRSAKPTAPPTWTYSHFLAM